MEKTIGYWPRTPHYFKQEDNMRNMITEVNGIKSHYLSLLNSGKILTEITKKLIVSRTHIYLKLIFQLPSYTIHQNRWEFNNLLWVRILLFVTSCLKIYNHKILKLLKIKL